MCFEVGFSAYDSSPIRGDADAYKSDIPQENLEACMNFWERSEKFSPILCRLLARHPHGKPLTNDELAIRMATDRGRPSGCGHYTIGTLSKATSWEDCTLPIMRVFLQACRIDFCNVGQMKRVDSYLRSKPSFTYLRKSPEWSTKWAPMLQRWRDSLPR